MRRRSEPHSFEENLKAEKARLEAAIKTLEPGPQRDLLERKLRPIETASHITSGWHRRACNRPKVHL
jgi:hypothetical protein